MESIGFFIPSGIAGNSLGTISKVVLSSLRTFQSPLRVPLVPFMIIEVSFSPVLSTNVALNPDWDRNSFPILPEASLNSCSIPFWES